MPLRNEDLRKARVGFEVTKERDTFVDQSECLRQIALDICPLCEIIERKAKHPLDAQLAENRDAFRTILPHPCRITLVACNIGKPGQAESHPFTLAKPAVHGQTFFEQCGSLREVALLATHHAQHTKHLSQVEELKPEIDTALVYPLSQLAVAR